MLKEPSVAEWRKELQQARSDLSFALQQNMAKPTVRLIQSNIVKIKKYLRQAEHKQQIEGMHSEQQIYRLGEGCA